MMNLFRSIFFPNSNKPPCLSENSSPFYYSADGSGTLDGSLHFIPSHDERDQGVHIPVLYRCSSSQDSLKNNGRPFFLFVHDGLPQTNLATLGPLPSICDEFGFNFVGIEWPGHGIGKGPFTFERLCFHIREVLWYLWQELEIEPESLILAGKHIGGGAVAKVAAEMKEKYNYDVNTLALWNPVLTTKKWLQKEYDSSPLKWTLFLYSNQWNLEEDLSPLVRETKLFIYEDDEKCIDPDTQVMFDQYGSWRPKLMARYSEGKDTGSSRILFRRHAGLELGSLNGLASGERDIRCVETKEVPRHSRHKTLFEELRRLRNRFS